MPTSSMFDAARENNSTLLSYLVEEGTIGMMELDLQTNQVTLAGRESLYRLLGLDEERVRMDWEQYRELYCHPGDQASLEQELSHALHKRIPFHSEYRLWNPVAKCWRRVLSFGHLHQEENRTFLLCGLREITGGDDSLREYSFQIEDRFRTVMDAAPFSCTFFDNNARPVDCNQAAPALFGLSGKEEYLAQFHALSPPLQPDGSPSVETCRENILQAFRTGRLSFRWHHQTLEGEPIPCSVTLARIRYLDDSYVVGYTWDERELLRSHNRLREADRRMKLMLDATPLCCSFWNRHLQIMDCSEAAVTLFRLRDKREFMTRFFELSPERQPGGRLSSELALEYLRSALKNGRARFEWVHRTLDGVEFPAEVTCVRVEYNGEHTVLGYTQDLSRQQAALDQMRQAREEMKRARDRAEESDRAKSEFLANMSHEIRTPMNAILGMTHLALKTSLTVTQRYYLEKSEHSAKTLLRIINDILDFSKVEAGHMELEQSAFSLADVLHSTVGMISRQAAQKKLRLHVEIDPACGDSLRGDPLRLSQILLNLLGNAVKFTAAGSVSVTVSPQEAGEDFIVLLFSVKDSGIGMTQEQVGRLFRPFSQADTSTTRRYGGTGLGLAICKRLCELMQGRIWCESHPSNGSTFLFTARFGRPSPLEEQAPANLCSPKRFLLLGSDEDALEHCLQRLHSLHCPVAGILRTPTDARKFRLPAQPVDLILADMEDASALHKILEILTPIFCGTLPPVICTADPEDLAQMSNLDDSTLLALPKPLTISSISDCVNNLDEEITAASAAQQACRVQTNLHEQYRILLVEDNEINQVVATELLRSEGYLVDVAENGRKALEALERHLYDLVLMDIQMPEMDGLAATREIRKNPAYRTLPIIAMTAHAMAEDRKASLEAGMNDHITKPINPDLLSATIDHWLQNPG